MRNSIVLVTLSVGAMGLPQAIAGTISAKDFRQIGDASLTFDSSSRLEWLDLSYTRGLTLAAVQAQLGIGGPLAGFRMATTSEVAGLVSSFAAAFSSPIATVTPSPVHDMMRFMNDWTGGDSTITAQSVSEVGSFDIELSVVSILGDQGLFELDAEDASGMVATFLVRQRRTMLIGPSRRPILSSGGFESGMIPLPTAGSLALAALVGLSATRRR